MDNATRITQAMALLDGIKANHQAIAELTLLRAEAYLDDGYQLDLVLDDITDARAAFAANDDQHGVEHADAFLEHVAMVNRQEARMIAEARNVTPTAGPTAEAA